MSQQAAGWRPASPLPLLGLLELLVELLLGRRHVTTIHMSSARGAASLFFISYSLINWTRPEMNMSSVVGLGEVEDLLWSSNLAADCSLSCAMSDLLL